MNEQGATTGERDAQEVVTVEPVRRDNVQSRLFFVARVCLLVAIVGASYLAWVALTGGSVAGCGPQSGCNRVLSSRWAYWLGLPVSLPALAVYFCLLMATLTVRQQRSTGIQQASLLLILTLSLLVPTAAFWFIPVQRLLLHEWCKFCLATHASAGVAACLLLFAVLSRGRPQGETAASIALSRRAIGLSVCCALMGLTILLAGQVLVKKRLYGLTLVSWLSGAASKQVSLHDGRFRLDPDKLPVLGSATATNFIVSVFDYTCNHCRALHPVLKAAEEKYRGRLGIIALPMPLDAACNPLILITASNNQGACEYAKLSLAVWRARAEAFREFDDWMFTSAKPPPLDQARTNAEAMVGKEALDRALTSSWVRRQLETDIDVYQANARLIADARLPQLVIGNVITHGAIETQEQLLGLIERHLLMVPSITAPINSLGQ